MKTETLYYGDCFEVMKKWSDRSIDLIYLDPPFNSQVQYNVLFGTNKNGNNESDLAQLTAFSDIWEWDAEAEQRVERIEHATDHPAHAAICAFRMLSPHGSGMLSYLSFMAERVAEMRRLLKDTGTIYLHCDPTASHYLKILMDDIFDARNFRNEIAWCYTGPSGAKRNFPGKHDIILRYAMSDTWTFNADAVRIPYKELYSDKGKDAKLWGAKGNLQNEGTRRKYEAHGIVPEDFWLDIPSGGHISPNERLNYPTQKPLALLRRIVTASSNEGDIVLDPFCGCGTAIEAAHSLRRKWIGIDISTYAIEVVRRERMNDMRIPLEGVPKDLMGAQHLAANKPFEFETWAVTRIPGFAPNRVQSGDGGIDGRGLIYGVERKQGLCTAQAKGGKPTASDLRAFCGAMTGGAVAIGIFITLKEWDTQAVRQCVAQAGTIEVGARQYPRLIMYSIDEYFHGIEPKLPLLAHPRTGDPLHKELFDV